MSEIIELYGCYRDNTECIQNSVEEAMCPYTRRRCNKTRKSNPDVTIGTCTVEHKRENVIICPHRLLQNRQIFIDCLHLLALHEPGNELYLIPEVTIPGGHVDYFLVSTNDNRVRDFVAIELQTLDTTGTVWPERQRLLSDIGVEEPNGNRIDESRFGINWKMTAKTILMQMHHKSETLEILNKHLLLVIQEPLLKYMVSEFSFDHISGVRNGDSIHIHSYDLERRGNGLSLVLRNRISTDSAGMARCLGLQAEARVELEEINRILEARLLEEYRFELHV